MEVPTIFWVLLVSFVALKFAAGFLTCWLLERSDKKKKEKEEEK